MPLPKQINLADCVPDPFGRANHIYHAPTDEVLHVDGPTARRVGKAAEKAQSGFAIPQDSDAADSDATTGITRGAEAVTPETTDRAEGEREGEDDLASGMDRAELLKMAEALELTVPDGLTDADLLALIEAEAQK